jgi:hypothetical protein
VGNCPTFDFIEYQLKAATTSKGTDTICRAETRCGDDEYETRPATATSDRTCAARARCDYSTQYAVEPDFNDEDRKCLPLTVCDGGTEFETKTATTVSDRACAVYNRTLPCAPAEADPDGGEDDTVSLNDPAYYEASALTPTSDRVCGKITQCAAVGAEYQAAAPTLTSDRECLAVTSACPASTFESAAPSATSDRRCVALTGCSADSNGTAYESRPPQGCAAAVDRNSELAYVMQATLGRPLVFHSCDRIGVWSAVHPPAFVCAGELDAANLTNATRTLYTVVRTYCPATCGREVAPFCADRRCTAATVCDTTAEFESVPLTFSADRNCSAATTCAVGSEYQTHPLTATSDRQCAVYAAAECHDREYEAVARTATTDRRCAAFRGPCDRATEYQAAPPTPTSDRRCLPLTVCGTNRTVFELAPPTATSDRVCATVTPPCAAGTEYQAAPPTPTSDRVCAAVTACVPGEEYEAAAPSATADRRCVPATPCSLTSYETAAAAGTADRTCVPCTPCRPGTHNSVAAGGCMVGQDSVCMRCSACVYCPNNPFGTTCRTPLEYVPLDVLATLADEANHLATHSTANT